MFENYSLVFPLGTNIHIVTFSIIAFEIVMFCFQIIVYLIRPNDLQRLWYLILLFLLISYNIAGGLFPDPRLSISIFYQTIIAYATGVIVSLFMPFYVYKYLELPKLKFYAYYGAFFFLVIPFFVTFLIPYSITKDVSFSSKLLVIVPFFYSVSLLITLIKAIKQYLKLNDDPFIKEKAIGVFIAFLFWIIGLTIVVFFQGEQVVEHVTTNFGFLILTIIYVRSTIVESKKEYSELQNLNEMLLQKVKERTTELEFAIEQKTNTFISLTHEIRTPLTLIKNYVEELIDKQGISDESRIIQENVEVLNHDLNTFFNEEKFLKGLSSFNHNKIIDFSKFLTDRVIAFKLYASKKNITISSSINPDIQIKSDPDALHSITNNLIENAIKYTPINGLISITLTTSNTKIIFAVKDNGCGIPQNLFDKIFDPYFQISNNQNGIGIGLSIVNNCVKSLSGKVVLKSKEYEGSEFIVELPLYSKTKLNETLKQDTSNKNLQNNKLQDSDFDVSKPYILVIEDNTDMLLYLRDKLKIHYNVFIADNGKIALNRLSNIHHLDLIISDVMMDEMDGIQFLKNISEIPKYAHIPFLFLSANTTAQNIQAGLLLGAIDYIQKPFNISDLILKINSIIANNKNHLQFVKNLVFNNMDKLVSENSNTNILIKNTSDNFETNCKKYNITNREQDIITLIQESLTHKEIAAKLFISDKTVHKHCENIFAKLNVNNKYDLLKRMYN